MRSWNAHNNQDDSTAYVDPSRLIAAADALLHAEIEGGKVSMWRDDAKPAHDGFSSLELVQALLFLRRLGLIRKEDVKPVRRERDTRPPT